MAIKVPGSLGGLQIAEESTYGVSPATDFDYIGFMRTMNATNGFDPEELQADGKRGYAAVNFGAQTAGITADMSIFRRSGSYDWRRALQLAMGASTGSTDDIASFTTLMRIARDQYVLAKGCKMDKLTLSSEGVGQQIRAKAEIKCMKLLPEQSSKAGFGTLGDEATVPEMLPMTYNAYPTSTIPGASTIPSSKFTLTISNGLKAKEGIVDGVPLAAGSGLVPDKCEISLELTVMSSSSFWDNMKLAKTSGFSVSLIIDGVTITLQGCYLPGDDLPSRSQSEYDETITIKANDLTYGV
ncbi:MAG: hypothetical protein RBR71_14290 [Gudongella sp.]|nr:hypothetical protein [Gudongella sp.]